MQLLSFLFRTYNLKIALVALVGFVAALCSTALIVVINRAMMLRGGTDSTLLLIFVGLCMLMLTAGTGSQLLLLRIGQSAIYDLRLELSRRVMGSSLRHFELIGPEKVLASLTDDINSIAMSLLAVSDLCVSTFTIILCLAYLAYLSPLALLGLLVFVACGVAAYVILQSRALRHLKAAREKWDLLMGHFRALTEGAKELKLHRRRREDFLSRELGAAAGSLRSCNLKGLSIYAVAGGWSQLLFYIVIGVLLFALPLVEGIQPWTVMGFVVVVLFIRAPIGIIVSSLPAIGRGNVAIRKVRSLGISLEDGPCEADLQAEPDPNPRWEHLHLKGVTHTYQSEQNDTFTLGPMDLSFRPAEIVFMVGGNGSGKSTFAKLITGLYAPDSGDVLLDGQPITDLNREHYRQHFSAVFSDFHLFESLLGLLSPELDARAKRYLAKLQLDQKVNIENGVLSTVKLSHGQRKRLALLTAFLEDRPFYVFDEWAADQDPEFKKVFYTELLPDLKGRGKAVLVITHDDRYYASADRLIKLDYGKVSFEGTLDDSSVHLSGEAALGAAPSRMGEPAGA